MAGNLIRVQATVAAGKMDQWFAVGHTGLDHQAHEDIVVARGKTLMHGALDGGERAGNHGHAGDAAVPGEAIEAVKSLARKAVGQGLLLLTQDIDSEVLGSAEVFNYGDLVAQTNQDERRVQRNRCERTDGETVRRSLGVKRGGDRDTGCKAAAGVPEFFGTYRGKSA